MNRYLFADDTRLAKPLRPKVCHFDSEALYLKVDWFKNVDPNVVVGNKVYYGYHEVGEIVDCVEGVHLVRIKKTNDSVNKRIRQDIEGGMIRDVDLELAPPQRVGFQYGRVVEL